MLSIYYAPPFPVEPTGIWVPWTGRSRKPVSSHSWKVWGHPFPRAQVPQSPWQEPSRKAQTHEEGAGVLGLWPDTGLGNQLRAKFVLLTRPGPIHQPWRISRYVRHASEGHPFLLFLISPWLTNHNHSTGLAASSRCLWEWRGGFVISQPGPCWPHPRSTSPRPPASPARGITTFQLLWKVIPSPKDTRGPGGRGNLLGLQEVSSLQGATLWQNCRSPGVKTQESCQKVRGVQVRRRAWASMGAQYS